MSKKLLLIVSCFIGALNFACAQHHNQIMVRRYRGTPQQMAYSFGKDEIERFSVMYREIMRAQRIDYQKERLLMLRTWAYLPYIDPEFKKEMEAFAQAAKVPFAKVLLANCMYDIMNSGSCRQVAAWRGEHLLHARNLDWPDWGTALRRNNVLLIRHYKKCAVATLTWPGFFGCLTGCNSHGLAVAYNQLPGGSISGEPVFFMLQRILRDCSTLKQAITIIRKSMVSSNGSIMISDARHKKAAVVDIRDAKILVRHATHQERFLINNNTCYFSQDGKYEEKRYCRGPHHKVVAAQQTLNVAGLQKVMAHPKMLLWINLLTVVFDLDNDCLYLSCGKYKAAQGPYKKFKLFKVVPEKGPSKK